MSDEDFDENDMMAAIEAEKKEREETAPEIELDDDDGEMDMSAAMAIAGDPHRIPVGLLFRNPDAPRYEDFSSHGIDMSPEEKLAGLNAALDRFAV